MAFTVIPDSPAPASPAGFTVVPDTGAAAPPAAPAGDRPPLWAVGLAMATGIDPQFFTDPEQGPAALKALARQGGLAGRYALQGLASITDPINAAVGLPRARDVVKKGLDVAGLPEPQTPMENFVGDVTEGSVPLLATGGAGAAMKAAAGPVARGVGAALTANPGAQAAAAGASAGAGSVGNRQLELSPMQNLWFSLLTGTLAPTAATAASEIARGGARAFGAAVRPFTESGQKTSIGQLLNRFSTDQPSALAGIEGAREFVPGSVPTTAEAAADPGLAGLQRGLQNTPEGAAAFSTKANAQNKARLDYLTQTAKTPQELQAAIADRESQAAAEYGTAFSSGGEINPQTNRMLSNVLDRPAIMKAWQQAETLAANDGMKPQAMDPNNPQFLHYIKLALDDQIGKSAASETSFGKNEMRIMTAPGGVKDKFLDVLDNISPLYGIARGNYQQASGPINRMSTLQDIMKRAQLATPNIEQDPVMSVAGWKRALAHPDVTDPLSGLLPEDQAMLGNVTSDLSRSAATATAGSPIKSDTAQNLATSNVIAAALGKGDPTSPIGRILAYPLKKAYEWSGANSDMFELLTKAALDPALAAELMRRAPTTAARTSLAKLLADRSRAFAIGTGVGSMPAAESIGAGQ
jgi:hypothetical protein